MSERLREFSVLELTNELERRGQEAPCQLVDMSDNISLQKHLMSEKPTRDGFFLVCAKPHANRDMWLGQKVLLGELYWWRDNDSWYDRNISSKEDADQYLFWCDPYVYLAHLHNSASSGSGVGNAEAISSVDKTPDSKP